ncbi:MAG: protein kinase [Pirellulales bacterium]|nr:protein kinase [Pirellulales bacterium]
MNQPSESNQRATLFSPININASRAEHGRLPARFGRYELLKVVGSGGMGTVYLAEDTVLLRQVALKIPNRVSSEATLHRLLQEARAAAGIHHPNVCSILDIGRQGEQPFFTMEYIQGRSLDQHVASGKPTPALQAVKMVMKIAAGLHAAHRQGIIHRDLKPANILLRDGKDPVITDFGLALRRDQADAAAAAGKLQGSPAYMSPEQVRCDFSQIGPATDVYGLGAILYELLSGRRPFDGQVPGIYSQVLTQNPEAPSNLIRGIDARLEATCMRALAKSPHDRFDSVAAFAFALKDCLPELAMPPVAVANRSETRLDRLPASSTARPFPSTTASGRPSARKSMTRGWYGQPSRQTLASFGRRAGVVSGIMTVLVAIFAWLTGLGYVMGVAAERSRLISVLASHISLRSPRAAPAPVLPKPDELNEFGSDAITSSRLDLDPVSPASNPSPEANLQPSAVAEPPDPSPHAHWLNQSSCRWASTCLKSFVAMRPPK